MILCGFGKGAGVALYAALMKLIPQPVGSRSNHMGSIRFTFDNKNILETMN